MAYAARMEGTSPSGAGWARLVRVVHVLLGGLLVFAGGGKLLTLLWPVDSLGWPSWLIVIGGATEIVLGLALLSGLARRRVHVLTLLLFVAFCALSTIQVIRGVPSCGCLAKIHVHPAWMLTFDVIVTATVAALLPFIRRPGVAVVPAAGRRRPLAGPLRVATGGVLIGAVSFGAILAATGLGRPLLGVAAPAVTLRPAVLDLGEVTTGEPRTVAATVVNETTTTVRLVGGDDNCICLVTEGLPAEVLPGGEVTLPLTVKPAGEGRRTVPFEYRTDQPGQPRVVGTLVYTAVPKPTPAAAATNRRDDPGGPVATAAGQVEDGPLSEDGR